MGRTARRGSKAPQAATAALTPPPYPWIAVGTPAWAIDDLPEDGRTIVAAEALGPHLHYAVGAFMTMKPDETFTDYTAVDIIASSETLALQRAKRVIPSKHYFRVERVSVHEPSSNGHA